MPLQDEMTFQRIEVMLDMQAKKINAEIAKLREELSQVKEELRKEIHATRQDPSFQQAGPSHVQMYSDVPPQAPQQPIPRYAQEQQAPRYAQEQYATPPQQAQGYAQQAYPQQGYPQQAPPQQQGSWNQPYPPQFRGGDKPPSTQPIDRNGIAPSDVSVEKFFNFSNKPQGKK
jgi:hypothetical protein